MNRVGTGGGMENKLYTNLENIIAHSDEVDRILGDIAFDHFLRAKERLARHHHGLGKAMGESNLKLSKSAKRNLGISDLSEHRVTQTKGKVDHYINLEGPAAMSVEEGHHNHWNGAWVEGLHIIKGAFWNVD